MTPRGLLSLLLLLPLLSASPAAGATPSPGRDATEWVLILDNSASMAAGSKLTQPDGTVESVPPADPDRLSVLATLIFRALLSPADRLSILTFQGGGVGKYRELPADPAAIRALTFNQSTPFTGPLRRAREILDRSQLPARVLLLVTDGAPSEDDPLTATEARRLLGLDTGPPTFAITSLGLTGGNPQMARLQQDFLEPLGQRRRIDSASDLIRAFTEVYAAHIRSRPLTGRLMVGGSYGFPVGRYVTEVLAVIASEARTGPLSAHLSGGGAATGEAGDNGCRAPPCHTYQVLRAPHDPEQVSSWSLHLDRSAGPAAYGIILRYELDAEIVEVPRNARVGEEIDVVARITWRGRTFNDSAFFAADGFHAEALLGGRPVPLDRREDGTFGGRLRVAAAGAQQLRVRFSNRWLDLSAAADVHVGEWLPLSLRVQPTVVDFGAWRGGRVPSQRCVTLDLSGSQNAHAVPLEAMGAQLPEGTALRAPTPLRLEGDTAQVCLEVRGCCRNLTAPPGAQLVLRGRDPHYHDGAVSLPIRFRIEPTPFLVCWWHVLAALAGGLFLIFVVTGLVKPRDFDREEVIRLAKTEQGLARADARRLRDLPGGRRGFYRHARVAFDGNGNAVSRPRGAALVLQAQRGDPLLTARQTIEARDPRTRKWLPREPGAIRRGVAYRSGDFYFRLG